MTFRMTRPALVVAATIAVAGCSTYDDGYGSGSGGAAYGYGSGYYDAGSS